MRSTGACLAVVAVAYAALWILVPRATFLPVLISLIDGLIHFAPPYAAVILTIAGMILMAAPTVAFMAVQIAMVYCFSRLRLNWRGATALLVGSLAAASLFGLLIVKQSGICAKIGRSPTLRETLYIVGAYSSILRVPMQLAIMSAACSLGYAVSLLVRDRNLLVPVVMFAAYIDFWTVTQGPVSTMLKKAPEVAMAVAAPIPAAGTKVFAPQVLIGPGDFLFMALVFAAAHRLELDGSRNFWYVFIGMTVGMLAVLFGFLPALPALIVLAVCVLAANWKHFKLSRQEIISTAVVGLVLLASLPLVWSVIRPTHAHKPPSQRAPSSTPR
ncbi:MAG: hypothetical protein QHI38_04510 [Armatimonadota bacterium]|nr:hypothetical protein [Armatimonadota bacterium]